MDLKPANVLVTVKSWEKVPPKAGQKALVVGPRGFSVRLSDFGLARVDPKANWQGQGDDQGGGGGEEGAGEEPSLVSDTSPTTPRRRRGMSSRFGTRPYLR